MTSIQQRTITVLSPHSGPTTYMVVFGYERPCGRHILGLAEARKPGWVFVGELPDADHIHVDGLVSDRLHEKVDAALPGGLFEFKGTKMRRLDETNLPAAGTVFEVAAMPPPKVLRSLGMAAPERDHDCNHCYWV